MKSLFTSLARLLIAVLALLASGAVSLYAEDVYVTGCTNSFINTCAPSCPYSLSNYVLASSASTACPVVRQRSVFGASTNAGWAVTPTLANHPGVYKVLVTKGATSDCPADLVVNMTATGGALADAGGIARTNVPTTAFQGSNSFNSWTLVGYITNYVAETTVIFDYASGGCTRFYMDAVDFQSVGDIVIPATPARITRLVYGNPLTLSGTGPVSHPFELRSSTNPANALNQWTRDKTNTDGTGSFTFSIVPGTAKAKFFRVFTQ